MFPAGFFFCIIQADRVTKYEMALISRQTLLKCSHIPCSYSTIKALGCWWEIREHQETFGQRQKEHPFLSQHDNCTCCHTVCTGSCGTAHPGQDNSSLWKVGAHFPSVLSGNPIPHGHRTDCGKAISPAAPEKQPTIPKTKTVLP